MPNCPTCGQETDNLAPLLDHAADWYHLEDLQVGQKSRADDFDAQVEMVRPPEPAEYDSYGETTSERIYMIVKVGDRFFKKEGWRSSYGGTDWDGECREVQPEPKTVVVYDYI